MPRKPIDWEAVEVFFSGGETGVERMAMHIIEQPNLWAEMKWPEVERVAKQVKIGRSVADIVVWHVDGSLTIVEVKKGDLSLREYCTGIGQLAYQSVMAMSDFQTFHVRRVLAMPGQFPVDVAIACAAEGVDMLPLCTVPQWIGFLKSANDDTDIADCEIAAEKRWSI